MLMNLYVLIIIIPIVQIVLSKNTSAPLKSHKNVGKYRDEKYFDNVVELQVSTSTVKSTKLKSGKWKREKNYFEIKALLAKLIEQIMELEKDTDSDKLNREFLQPPTEPENISFYYENQSEKMKKQNDPTVTEKPKWGHWTDWSSCSVSCGKGRQIRWRHCIESCSQAETEMEEKACQLPACSPGKLFGVFSLR